MGPAETIIQGDMCAGLELVIEGIRIAQPIAVKLRRAACDIPGIHTGLPCGFPRHQRPPEISGCCDGIFLRERGDGQEGGGGTDQGDITAIRLSAVVPSVSG